MLLAIAMVLGGGRVLAQAKSQGQGQNQAILRPRKSHDVEYVQKRIAKRVTMEQRRAAAARMAAARGQVISNTVVSTPGTSGN